MYVALVALGTTSIDYVIAAEAAGGRSNVWDEVWTCNGYGNVLDVDRIFCMDDIRMQEKRVNNLKIQNLCKQLARADRRIPIYTSRAHRRYPALVRYPLEAVINACGTPYFNNTGAYMIAYALYKKVTRMDIFGFDFRWPGKPNVEGGQGCCEYWLGRAMERGIRVMVTPASTLMDTNIGTPLYGYDSQVVCVDITTGKAKVSFRNKPLPTEEEIEARYSTQVSLCGDI